MRYREFQSGMRDVAEQWFGDRTRESRYPWQLPYRSQWPANIILPEVADFVQQEVSKRHFALHRNVHNGLSSQAMAFNLLGPLHLRNDLQPLRRAFHAGAIPWPQGDACSQFELEDPDVFNERQMQPTSVDFALTARSGMPKFVAVECKLSEPDYGGCSKWKELRCGNPSRDFSQCYLHTIGRRYWRLLEDFGIIGEAWLNSSECPLKRNYQFYRLLLFALRKNGVFVLLYDDRSPVFVNDRGTGLHQILTGSLPDPLRHKVYSLPMQGVWREACAESMHDDWAPNFGVKYGLQ